MEDIFHTLVYFCYFHAIYVLFLLPVIVAISVWVAILFDMLNYTSFHNNNFHYYL